MRVAARAAASTASAVRRGHHLLLPAPVSTRPLSTQLQLQQQQRRRNLFVFSSNHRRNRLRLVSMSANESNRQPAPASPSYVVTVHAADEKNLELARSRLGSTRELSAGGGATATVEFADGAPPSSSSSSSSFDPALYFSSLRTRSLGRVLLVSPLLPSTQDLVQKASSSSVSASTTKAEGGVDGGLLPDGTVCVADAQASGRGRGANSWSSPPGSLAFSLTSDVRVPGTRLPFVQYLVSLALVRAARRQVDEAASAGGRRARPSSAPVPPPASPPSSSSALPASPARRGDPPDVSESIRIKWPNDVYARGKKLAGVLCHSTYASADGPSARGAVVGGGGGSGGGSGGGCFRLTAGVGINVSNAPPPGAESLAGLLLAPEGDAEGSRDAGASRDTASPTTTTSPSPLCREEILASTLSELELLLDSLSSPSGFSEEMRGEYEACWLHSGQVVEVEDGVDLMSPSSAASAASSSRSPATAPSRRRQRVRITGLSESGFLAAVDADGEGDSRYELHPDGNSLDFFEGLVRRKATK